MTIAAPTSGKSSKQRSRATTLLPLLVRHLRPYRLALLAIVALQLLGTIASLYLPSLNADIIDNGVAKGNINYIVTLGLVMLGVALVQIVCSIAATYFAARSAMGFGRDLRRAIFHRVGTFSDQEVQQFGAPSLITRTTNDVTQVQTLVLMTCTLLVVAPIMCIGGIIMALRQDLGLSWLVVVSVPLLTAAVGLIASRMLPQFRLMQRRLDAVNRVLREQITGVRVVRAFVRESLETDRFDGANRELTATALAVGKLMALMFPTVMFVMNLSSVAVLWFGGIRIGNGSIEVGTLTAFLAYLIQILMSVMMAVFMMVMVPRASVSAERIGQVLDTTSSVVPPLAPTRLQAAQGLVEFAGVTFAYPGADDPVLREVTFTARPGQTTAIVGATGSGKTTLISLIPRLFDVTAGSVRIDGIDVRDLAAADLWAALALVPQRSYLFSGTVASNLRFGNANATDEELWAALKTAQAANFVRQMPGGLAAPISQGGTNLSGGQRQRLAIARALVRDPAIYLFDDSFSALDVATDARLRAALRKSTSSATIIIVAQRVSTIRDANQIIVLEDGAIIGSGTYDELVAGCGTFQEIVESQLAAEADA